MGSGIQCECGGLVHTNIFAGAHIGLVIYDDEYDQLGDVLTGEELHRELFVRFKQLLSCKQCGRLFLEDGSRAHQYQSYLPEGDVGAAKPHLESDDPTA
jgi:hypothetical protein